MYLMNSADLRNGMTAEQVQFLVKGVLLALGAASTERLVKMTCVSNFAIITACEALSAEHTGAGQWVLPESEYND